MTSEAQTPAERENADLRKQNEVLRDALRNMSPHLLDDERERARATWEAALYAHNSSPPGQPGPWAVIAAALRDAEKRGVDKAVDTMVGKNLGGSKE